MIKYIPASQLTLDGFSHPFEQSLYPDNRWVRWSTIIHWDGLARVYSKSLNSTDGRKSMDVRMVTGVIIVKHKLSLDDRGTVAMLSENM